jgi:hypothetical protein
MDRRGRLSIDPLVTIRMLIVGYVFAIRSERQLCREVQVNLADRWFCDLDLEDPIHDHSAFFRARNERFRESDIFRCVFERVVVRPNQIVISWMNKHSSVSLHRNSWLCAMAVPWLRLWAAKSSCGFAPPLGPIRLNV